MRSFELIFGPTPVPAKGCVTLQAMAEIPDGTKFSGQKLVNKKDGSGLSIFGLFIGDKPQMPKEAMIPVNFFGETVLDNELTLDPCDGKTWITMQIMNQSDEERVFSMALNGEVS